MQECINDLKGTRHWAYPGHASQLPMVHACKVSLKESKGSSWILLNDASKNPVQNMGFLVSYKLTFKNMNKYSLCETLKNGTYHFNGGSESRCSVTKTHKLRDVTVSVNRLSASLWYLGKKDPAMRDNMASCFCNDQAAAGRAL